MTNIYEIPSPCYVVDRDLLIKNLEVLRSLMDRTGCKILLAQKAFSMFALYPLIGRYLTGTTASSLFEARLGHDEMGGETHIFSPAYREEELEEIMGLCGHMVFNSFGQWVKYRERIKRYPGKVKCGIRVNPEHSEQEGEIYDPCAKLSRLGVTLDNFKPEELAGLSGLHFHTLCEQNAGPLMRTAEVFEKKFGKYLEGMEWVNFGGGHHITREDYDQETLVAVIKRMQRKYGLTVYLEPGEAVALNAGFLVAEVLDIVHNGMDIAILDASAACHMPDVLEMPYRPRITGADRPGIKRFTYRLGGNTCLAGDIIGDYSFDRPLQAGDRLVFEDMAIYSMVKNNTFNGVNLPSIGIYSRDKGFEAVKSFGYEDFKGRLS